GDDGAVVVAGKPADSPLYEKLAAKADPHMPPKKQLSDTERESVKEWIAALTAAAPAPAKAKVARHFDSANQAIEDLIKEGWEKAGVKPAQTFDDRVWCRRVYLDLIGRIPTQAEVAEFLAMPEPDRHAALVDRLLASTDYPVRMRELWDA